MNNDKVKLPSIEQLLTKVHVMIAQGFAVLDESHPSRIELEQIKKLCNELIKSTEEQKDK